MYTKDKSNRITLRLNDDQFAFVRANADQLDVSPSDFLRMVINSALSTARAVHNGMPADEALKRSTGLYSGERNGEGRENDKTDQHNLVQQ